MFAADFLELCTQVIAWQRMTGRDQYGKPTYAAAVTFAGRYVNKVARVAGFSKAVKGEGAEFVSQAEVYMLPYDGVTRQAAALPAVGYEDRIYVQGDTVFPPVIAIDSTPDETGVAQYMKVSLGNANG